MNSDHPKVAPDPCSIPPTTTIPAAPERLVATAVNANQIQLSWSSSGVGVTEYRIERCRSEGCADFVEIGRAGATRFSDTGLSPTTFYSYRVRAFDGAALSDYSNIANAATRRGQGSATIDGVFDPGEWENAARVSFKVKLPAGGATSGTFYLMNDASNLYLAFTMDGPPSLLDLFRIEFDDNNNGQPDSGEDVLSIYPLLGFQDETRTTCLFIISPCADSILGGTHDGEGVRVSRGETTTFEIVHPLHTGDVNDFSLRVGDTVGLSISVHLLDVAGDIETDFPGSARYLSYQVEP